jgi:hypothetical protein
VGIEPTYRLIKNQVLYLLSYRPASHLRRVARTVTSLVRVLGIEPRRPLKAMVLQTTREPYPTTLPETKKATRRFFPSVALILAILDIRLDSGLMTRLIPIELTRVSAARKAGLDIGFM